MKKASYYKEIVDKMNNEESQAVWESLKDDIEAEIKKSAENGSYNCFLTFKNGLKGYDIKSKTHVRDFLVEKLVGNGFRANTKILSENSKRVLGIMVSFK